MKKIICLALSFFCAVVFAQNTPKEVSLIVSADGATKTEATNNALRSAIEQTFGTFVSTNTEILNDQLVKDEIATISSGNIRKFKEISYFETENNQHWITLEVTVSLKKLSKYAKGKGSKCELAGATFSANRRLYEFNRAATEKAYENLYTTIRLAGSSLFDYTMMVSEPYVKGGNNYVNITVTVLSNRNTKKMRNYIISTLYSLSTSNRIGKQNQKHGFNMYSYKITTGKDAYGNGTRWFYAPVDYHEINNALNDAASSYDVKDNLQNRYQITPAQFCFVRYDQAYGGSIYITLDGSNYSYSSECQVLDIAEIAEIELKPTTTQTIFLPSRNIMHKMIRWQSFGLYNCQLLGSYKYLSFDRLLLDDEYSKVFQYSHGLFFGGCKHIGIYGKINWGHGNGKTISNQPSADTLSRLDGIQFTAGLMFRYSSILHGYCGVGINNYQLKSRHIYEVNNPNMFEWHVSDPPAIYKDLSGYLVDAGVLLHYWYMTISVGGTYYLSTKRAYLNFGVGVCL